MPNTDFQKTTLLRAFSPARSRAQHWPDPTRVSIPQQEEEMPLLAVARDAFLVAGDSARESGVFSNHVGRLGSPYTQEPLAWITEVSSAHKPTHQHGEGEVALEALQHAASSGSCRNCLPRCQRDGHVGCSYHSRCQSTPPHHIWDLPFNLGSP